MKKSVAEMKFISKSKERVRRFILAYVRRSKSYLDFYGNGEMHSLVRKKTNTKMISIDSDPKLKCKLSKRADTIFTNLQSYCQRSTDRFDCIWLDYCGSFSQAKLDDLIELPEIMDDSGYLFITLFMGRENFIPKGTAREIIEYGTLMSIQKELMENNLKVELISKIKYITTPKYNVGERKKASGSTMIVYGFKWLRLAKKSNAYKFNSIVKTLIDNV